MASNFRNFENILGVEDKLYNNSSSVKEIITNLETFVTTI
jgi:hypothetical protein